MIGVLEGPLLGLLDSTLLISFPGIGDLLIQRIIQVWERHQSLDREEHRSNLESWRPLVLQDIEANSAELVNVGVVDLGSEEHLGWNHWVFIRQEEFAVKNATFVRGLGGTSDLDEEMSWVFLIWFGVNADDWVLSETLSFLQCKRHD